MAHAFFLGIDAGPNDDGSSHAVAHTLLEKEQESSDDAATYRLDHIQHHTDVSSADDLAGRLQGFVAERPYIGRTSIIANRGNEFGEALVEALRDRGLDPVAATLTQGTGTTSGGTDEMEVHMGGTDVIRTLADLYRDGKMVLEGHTTEVGSRLARDVQMLAEQLNEADGNIEALETSTDGPSFDPEAIHVTSAALAAWLGAERSFDPSQHLKESPQTGSSSAERPEL